MQKKSIFNIIRDNNLSKIIRFSVRLQFKSILRAHTDSQTPANITVQQQMVDMELGTC